MAIDDTFDFRSDADGGDPDSYSPTLRRYHQLLWGRPLPNGAPFDLVTTRPGTYLYHQSDLGEFFLSSDAVIPTLRLRGSAVVSRIPVEETEAFNALGYTIGGMMIWPSNKIDNKLTINGARGFNRAICDRFDLTLECVRRHYAHEPSPLAEVLDRYSDYFALFDDFSGFVEHFLLQDLITPEGAVRFATDDFDDFNTPAVPQDLATYVEYRRRSMEFIAARNRRIVALGL